MVNGDLRQLKVVCEKPGCFTPHVAYAMRDLPVFMSHLGPLKVEPQAKGQQGLPDLLHHETLLRFEGHGVHCLRKRAGSRDGIQ